MMKFNIGDYVRIKPTSKSKYKGAVGVITGYCCGQYPNICRVRLWHNKTVHIFDYSLEAFIVKEIK